MSDTTGLNPIVIRRAGTADAAALERLAALDSAHLPSGDLLVAEVDGEPRAALRIADGAFVADPFWPTAELVELLRVRARTRAVGVTRARRLAGRRLRPA